jgi:hypothetical protein
VRLEVADPAIAGHRIVLVAKERRLAEVMAQLARFLATPPGASQWERRRERGAFAYVLVEGTSSRAARAEIIEKRDRSAAARVVEALELAGLDDAGLGQHRGRNPRLAAGRANYPLAYRLARTLTPEQLGLALQTRGVSIPFDGLGREQQWLVRSGLSHMRWTTTTSTPDGDIVTRYDGSRDFRSASLEVGFSGSPERPGLKVMIRLDPYSAMGCPNVIEPPIPPEEEQPAWLKDALKEGAEKEEARRRRALGPRPPRDPALLQTVTIRRTTKIPEGERNAGALRRTFAGDALQQISEQTGMPAIADYDPGFDDYYARLWFKSLPEDLVDLPVWEALDAIARVWNLQWEKKDGWLRVRSPRAPFALAGELDLSPPWEAPPTALRGVLQVPGSERNPPEEAARPPSRNPR